MRPIAIEVWGDWRLGGLIRHNDLHWDMSRICSAYLVSLQPSVGLYEFHGYTLTPPVLPAAGAEGR